MKIRAWTHRQSEFISTFNFVEKSSLHLQKKKKENVETRIVCILSVKIKLF